mmetsp:Transcript_3963/g.13290  ORF Transcript_3963/g.13290 Transcript_3963/m.13290 type:complete len:267 (+) Transcript_3963:319-1119(+)
MERECRCSVSALRRSWARAATAGKGTFTWMAKRRSTASSRSKGRFVAPRSTTRPAAAPSVTPSICTRNSVFSRRPASLSEADRAESTESTSSKKTTLGARSRATWKRARTIFSDSPCHFEVSEDAETAKNVARHCEAAARARNVLPLPGGPYIKMPRGGARKPVKSAGFSAGNTTASQRARFASSRPMTSSQRTPEAPAGKIRSCIAACSSSAGWAAAPATAAAPPPTPVERAAPAEGAAPAVAAPTAAVSRKRTRHFASTSIAAL